MQHQLEQFIGLLTAFAMVEAKAIIKSLVAKIVCSSVISFVVLLVQLIASATPQHHCVCLICHILYIINIILWIPVHFKEKWILILI